MVRKRMITIFLCSLFVFAVVSIGMYLVFFFNMINSDFTTEAVLKFSAPDNEIGIFVVQSFQLTDYRDINELKKIFRGRALRDSPSCGFVTTVSITMKGRENNSFCIALDGCPIVRVNNSDRFMVISYSQREIIDNLFARYGFAFPAI